MVIHGCNEPDPGAPGSDGCFGGQIHRRSPCGIRLENGGRYAILGSVLHRDNYRERVTVQQVLNSYEKEIYYDDDKRNAAPC